MPEKKTTQKSAKSKSSRKKAAPRKKVAADHATAKHHEAAAPTPLRQNFLFAVGRRKTAIARVRLFQRGSGLVTINGKPIEQYFPTPALQHLVKKPLELTGDTQSDISVKVTGGGVHSQAESVRHGIARSLLLVDPNYRASLKPAGLLTRDARVKERKKYGLKRARRAPQWQKR